MFARRTFSTAILALAACTYMGSSAAAPGSVDTTFGSGGTVVLPVWGNITALAQQSDGKILVAGVEGPTNNRFVARYLVAGSLDPSFGSGGIAYIADAFDIMGVAEQPNSGGKILVAYSNYEGTVAHVARLMPDGGVDSSYPLSGGAAAPSPSASALIVASDGSAFLFAHDHAGVSNGNFEDVFPTIPPEGSGSIAPFVVGYQGAGPCDVAAGFDAYAYAVQVDGKRVVVGHDSCDFNNSLTGDLAFVRINPDLTYDTGFGTGGKVIMPEVSPSNVQSVVLLADGRIVYAFGDLANNDFALMRLTSAGALDTSFGSSGIAQTAIQGRCCVPLLQPDGRIVVVGGGPNPLGHPLILARFLSNGALDATFGTGGSANGPSIIYSAAIRQADGRVLVAGEAQDGTGNAVLIRFETGYASSATLASSANPSVFGHGVTFTATITGGSTPVGNVAFLDGATLIPGCSAQAVSLSHAQCTTSSLSTGTHSITASYVDTSGYYAPSISAPLSQQVLAIGPTDVNGDGHPDIIWNNTTNGATYAWYMGGTPPALISDAFIAQIDPSWQVQGIADFNGDTHPDLVWRNTANGDCYVWYMNGVTFMSDAFLFSLPPQWVIQGLGDFNADGKPDFFMRNTDPASGVGFVWYFNNATPIGSDFLFGIDPVWKVVAVADFNSDGQPDLLFRNVSAGNGLAFVWNTQFTGGATSLAGSTPPIFSIDPTWEVAQVADWNGDGVPDLVFWNSASGVVFVWYLNSGPVLGGSDFIIQIDPSWQIVPRR